MLIKISEIQIVPIKPNNGLVGFASFIFDNCFYFSSIGIYTRPQGGYRLTYPTRKTPINNLHIFHPINKEVAMEIEKMIISKFENVMKSYDGYNSYNSE